VRSALRTAEDGSIWVFGVRVLFKKPNSRLSSSQVLSLLSFSSLTLLAASSRLRNTTLHTYLRFSLGYISLLVGNSKEEKDLKMDQPIPVILCGKTAEIAKAVVNGLQPEIEGLFLPPLLPPLSALTENQWSM
jgi:hypothetical protein